MPRCKNCGARITKFNKDICPICGEKTPLKGVESDTVEITSEIDLKSGDFAGFKPKEKSVTAILFFFLGFTGAGFFYLVKKKEGLIWLLSNIVAIGLLFLLFNFAIKLDIVWSIVIPFIISYIINICVGLYFLFKQDLKDGRGEFLK